MPRVDSDGGVRVSAERFVLPSVAVEELRARLLRVEMPPRPRLGLGARGPSNWFGALLEDWREFDANALQRRLDGFHHFRADVDGQTLHVLRTEGRGPSPLPLLPPWLARLIS